MKAVNLIPKDLRGASAPGRTGIGVYVVLGALAAAVVLVTTWGMASRSVTNKQNEVTRVTNEASLAEQQAGELEPYKRFAELRQKRAETVATLARNRFNWPYALREVSRVLPEDTWLNQLVGTVAPGVTIDDTSGGDTSTLRSQLQVPALELAGCSMSQSKVAKYLAALRQIDGVTRVTLSASEKMDSSGGGASVGASDSDCRQGNSDIPKFGLVVFFERSTATASTAAPGAAPVAPSNGATPSGSGTSGSSTTSGTATTASTTAPAQQGAGK